MGWGHGRQTIVALHSTHNLNDRMHSFMIILIDSLYNVSFPCIDVVATACHMVCSMRGI